MKNFLLLAGMLLVGLSAYAQDDWIALQSGDTLYGKIGFIIKDRYHMDEVQIRVDKKKQTFTPLQVKRMEKKDNEYIPIKLNAKYQFGLVVKEGYLSWYRYISPEGGAYENFSMDVLIKKDGEMLMISNLFIVNPVKKFLDDCVSLTKKLDEKEFTGKDLDKIIDYYNAWIESRTETFQQEEVKIESIVSIDGLMTKVKEDELLAGNEELQEMLMDVRSKKREGKPVPGYLTGAINDALQNHPDLLAEFKSIVE